MPTNTETTETRVGTPPSTRLNKTQAAAKQGAILTKQEISKLAALGYTKEHYGALPNSRAREIIAQKIYRPGSRAFNNAQPPDMRVSDSQTDDAIQERNADKPASSGIDIIVDEYTQRCVKGDSPLDATINECQEVFPNDVIRMINPDLPPVAGPVFQPIRRKSGEVITEGGLVAARMPRDVYEEAFVAPNNQRSRQMTGEISKNTREDGDVQLSQQDAHLAPTEGRGLRTEIHSGAF